MSRRTNSVTWQCAILLLAALGALRLTAMAAPQQQVTTISPDAGVQATLSALARETDRRTFRQKADELADAASKSPDVFVGQLLFYVGNQADSAAARTLVGRVIRRIDLDKESMVTALVPHLEDGNAAVRESVRSLLHGCEDASATRPPDFSPYRAIIEADVRNHREPRRALVEFMFETDAGEALSTMLRASGLREPGDIKPIVWGRHVIDDLLWQRRFGFAASGSPDAAAAKQLDALSRHSRWWVRLYAAAIARLCTELASRETNARIGGDANVIVRGWLTRNPAK